MLHPATEAILRYFEFEHLPGQLQRVSRPFGQLARYLVLPAPEGLGLEGAEATTALRKLLEGKDCAVRAALVPADQQGPEDVAPSEVLEEDTGPAPNLGS